MTLRRTFKVDGHGRDPKYVFAILDTWVGLGSEGIALRAVLLANEQMHDSDRDLLRRFYRCLVDMADGADTRIDFVNLLRELWNVIPGSME